MVQDITHVDLMDCDNMPIDSDNDEIVSSFSRVWINNYLIWIIFISFFCFIYDLILLIEYVY